jgi:hypothetical protein
MKVLSTTIPIILLAVVATLAAAGAQSAGITARDGLEQAQQAVKAWQSDATFSGASTTVLKQDGTATVWTYNFISPTTVTCARIILVAGSPARVQDLGSCTPAKPVATTFVDSPAMLKAAVAAGFKPAEESNAQLAFKQDAATGNRECWVVYTIADFDKQNAWMRGWCVDPATGEFVVRLSGHN